MKQHGLSYLTTEEQLDLFKTYTEQIAQEVTKRNRRVRFTLRNRVVITATCIPMCNEGDPGLSAESFPLYFKKFNVYRPSVTSLLKAEKQARASLLDAISFFVKNQKTGTLGLQLTADTYQVTCRALHAATNIRERLAARKVS